MKKKLTKLTAILLAFAFCFCMLSACGGKTEPQPAAETQKENSEDPHDLNGLSGDLMVYAAASMTESIEAAEQVFLESNWHVEISNNYGSSGDLARQITEGAECDLFIAASEKTMDQAEEAGNVVEGTRTDLLENKCVLVVPENNPANIHSFEDLKAAFDDPDFIFAMGGESVPVGAYSKKILESLGMDEAALQSQISYGDDAKGVTAAVSEGIAQAAIIYATDAVSAGLEVVEEATEEMTGGKVIYPVALITNGKNPETAEFFLDFLKTPEAAACFEAVGFTVLN